MLFSKSVLFSRLVSLLTRNITARWIRLVCLVSFFAIALSSLPVHLKHDSATAQGSRPRRTQGPPSRNLPNLDDVRRIEPGTPKIMPPVPATKCRGRDEKCKKAKGKISNNLLDNQDRLQAYAGHRSLREYADWLNSGIPALSMLAHLIYWPASMISDFSDAPYRDGGGALAESATKSANRLKKTYGNAASRGPRKEYGYRSGRSPVAAQSGGVVSLNPGAYETPDSTQPIGSFVFPVNDPSNTGHAESAAGAGGPLGFQALSCRWLNFSNFSGGSIVSIKLKIDHASGGWMSGLNAYNNFSIEYSLNGGASWIEAVSRSYINSYETGTFSVDLPTTQDLSLVQVRDTLGATAIDEADVAAVIATISNIHLEVETVNCIANVPGDRWRGEYYTNTTLTGSPAMVRDDGAGFLNLNFGGGSPGLPCGLSADSFSARWTRTVNFAQDIYRFTVTGDDGVRLYVDGQLRIDKWILQPPTTYTADVFLSAGNHEVKLEYYENNGGAVALLSWTSVGGANCLANVPADRWRGEYYNNTTLTGSVAMVRDDGAGFLNFDFGAGSPSSACGVSADNFSARWARTVNFAQDIYRFSVTVDDGARLYVDGQLVIDRWIIQPGAYTADVPLSAGNHEIKLEFFEAGGFAKAVLSWTSLSGTSGDLNMALIDPINRIGSPGKDLLSRNCNWSLPLLSLPGRAGLDLGLALSLNSLVYTRAGSVMYFDPTQGYPAPGFSMGFPEIRNAFINTDAGAQSYLLSMPSGRRVEFRQISTNVYEAVDSSYMLLTHDPVNSVFVLYTTDGTQCRFEDVTGSGDYKCKQIKDRNGNFITIGYGSLAEIRTVIDTLGRVSNFNYDGFNHLLSITQNWGGQTHTWATFAYGTQTIQTNFPGLTLNGTTNGTPESVLLRVGLADGSVYSFEYNTYAQVKTIRRYAPNNSNPVNFPGDYFQRAYTTYGLPDTATNPQMDCPRATSRTDWAADWNSGVTVAYAADLSHSWGQVTFPDGTIYKEFFATTGWQRGLTTQTENWSGGVRKKWTTLQWTQDNTGVVYPLNPRVTETIVNDEVGNRRRTTVDYYTSFGLPSDVKEYDADTTTVLRLTHTDYNLSAVYTDRRIIGLPSASYLKDGNNTLFSKIAYEYDLNPNPNPYLQHPGPTAQHDTANYGSGFVQGRGNLNRNLRWDVTDPDNPSKASEYEIGYNTSGSVTFTRDPLDHQTSIIYADSFSDGQNNRNTYAYPTKMTDPDTFSSFVQYNYDFGAVTWTQNPKGATVTRNYDAAGRVERVRNEVNGAYTRYGYAPNQSYVQSFTTINDLNPANEFYSITVVDGHDRVRGTASDHPNSVGQYKAQYNLYDVMGRLAQQTNPTEIDSSWQPAGDNVAAGWIWRYQSYDWQGRSTVSTNQDGTTKEILYGGCGCAGGQVVVTRDEVGRRQKMTYDILGRLKTTQALFIQPKDQPLNGDGDVYSTTTITYNVRDQVTEAQDIAGTNGVAQITTEQYDGFGRLWKRKAPRESGDTLYEYNNDGTVRSMTDARLAVRHFSYNNRGQIKDITFTTPVNVEPANSVHYEYDSAGNKTQMVEKLPSGAVWAWTDYDFDSSNLMQWERRTFSSLPGFYKLNYQYNAAGSLKQIAYESSAYPQDNFSVYYDHDKAGRMTSISGSPIGGVTQYASGMTYRAWSALKGMTYGNGYTLSVSYTERQQLEQFELKNSPALGSAPVMKTWDSYYPDGRVKFVRQDLDGRFHRAFDYDHAGRLKEAYSGEDACNFAGQSCANPQPAVYRHTYVYDQWDNLTSRTGNYWGHVSNLSTAYDSANNHIQSWGYDAAGNITNDTINNYKYDTVGRSVQENSPTGNWVKNTYSGDGFVSYREELQQCGPECYPYRRTYYIRSTVLGGKAIVELDGELNQTGPYGDKLKGFVYAGTQLLAEHFKVQLQSGIVDLVTWHYRNPATDSEGTSISLTGNSFSLDSERDATGVDVGINEPLPEPPPSGEVNEPKFIGESAGEDGGRCTFDGITIGCGLASHLLYTGTAIIAPEQKVRGHYDPDTGKYDGFIIWNGQEVNKEGSFEYGYTYKRFNPEIDPETGEPVGEVLGYRTVEVEYVGAIAGEPIGGGGGGGGRRSPVVLPNVTLPNVALSVPRYISDPCVFFSIRAVPIDKAGLDQARKGIATLLDFSNGVFSPAQTAYVLATAYHETDRYRAPGLEEYASGAAYEGRKDLGNVMKGDGRKFKGRGYVQVTGRVHYQKWSNILGLDLVNNPQLVSVPEIAATIGVFGMQTGNFTGVSLGRYVNSKTTDFVNARRVINGVDRAQAVANYAKAYYNVLGNGCHPALN